MPVSLSAMPVPLRALPRWRPACWAAMAALSLVAVASGVQAQVLRPTPEEARVQAPAAAPRATAAAQAPAPVPSTRPTATPALAPVPAARPRAVADVRRPSAAEAATATSESLQALLARVVDQDPQVRVAQLLLQATEERRLQSRSRLGPSVTLSSSYGRAVDNEFGLQVNRTTNRSEAGVRWNLLNYGNDLAEFRAASRDVMAAAEDLRRAREDTAERVAEAYADLLRIERLMPRAAERLDALRRLTGQVQRQVEAGKVSESDMQQAQTSLLDAELVQEQLVADAAAARQRLAAVVGQDIRPVQDVQLPDAATAGLPRPGQVLAAQERAGAARTRVRPVSSLLAPRVDLEFRHQLSNQTNPQPTTEQQHGWQLTARWDIPVGGELQARRAEGQRRAEAAEAEAERVLRGVQAELTTLGPRIGQAQRAVALLERQVAQYDSLVRAGELQFEAGRRTLAQLMQLHDSRFNAEQRRSDQAHRLLTARLRQLALQGELLPALGLARAPAGA